MSDSLMSYHFGTEETIKITVALILFSLTSLAQTLPNDHSRGLPPLRQMPSLEFSRELPEVRMEPITREVLESMGLDDLEYEFGKEKKFYYGQVKLGRFHLDGTFHMPERMERRFLVTHSQSLEVYNFSINEWVKASIMPTESIMLDGQYVRGQGLKGIKVGGVHLSHMSGIKFKGKKTEVFFAIGPKYHFNEVVNESPWGVGFKFRIKLR